MLSEHGMSWADLAGFIWFHLVSSGFIWFHLVSSGFIWFHLVSSGFIWFHLVSSAMHFSFFFIFSPFVSSCFPQLVQWQDLERFPCEELQREDGLRSPGGAELTLLDVPGGTPENWCCLHFIYGIWRLRCPCHV